MAYEPCQCNECKKYPWWDCFDFFLNIVFFILLIVVVGFLIRVKVANAVMRRGTHSMPITMPTAGSSTSGSGGSGDAILLEDGASYLLLEDGSKILLE